MNISDDDKRLIEQLAHDAMYKVGIRAYFNKSESSDRSEFIDKVQHWEAEVKTTLLKAFEDIQTL